MPGALRSRVSWAACTAVLMLATGLAGWAIGHNHRSGAEFRVEPGTVVATPSEGTAYLGADQQFAYSFPPDMPWIDADGVTHEGGRPACVSYYHAVHVKNMEAVIYPIGGGSTGTVLWVQC